MLIRHLKRDFKKKAIICSNVADSVEKIRDEIDRWLNEVDAIVGDTMMILGDLEAEWKHVSITKFCEILNDPTSLMETNKFSSRIDHYLKFHRCRIRLLRVQCCNA